MNSSSLLNCLRVGRSKYNAALALACFNSVFFHNDTISSNLFLTNHELELKLRKDSNLLPNERRYFHSNNRHCMKNERWSVESSKDLPYTITVCNHDYATDDWTNVTPKILSYVGRTLHLQKDHPLCLIKEAIVNHFYATYRKSRGPIFAVFDSLPPVVSVEQNFDVLLIPKDHVSRRKNDNYYVNKDHLLRAHTTAHEHDLIKSGLDAFLTVGDVFRRDEIDSTHFPVFHQLEGARLFTQSQLFSSSAKSEAYEIFENGVESKDKQDCHTLEASKLVEHDLKTTLIKCMQDLFGKDLHCKWVDAYFPFTHPSFELEIKYKDEWIEMLGCGVLRQEILNRAGAGDKIGWAFGLGLERLAMRLFDIPDIRYFWSTHESVLSQFRGYSNLKDIKFKSLHSNHPCVANDLSFWIPDGYSSNDFYDLIRDVDSELVETVTLVDEFTNSKTGKTSHCYRIFYRHTSRGLTQEEVTQVHELIKREAVKKLGVEGRW